MTARLHGAGTRAHVAIGRVEQELSALVQQTAEEQRADLPVARVRLLNLVVYTEDAATLAGVDRLADVLPVHHPCRLIAVHLRPDDPGDRVDAAVSARCTVDTGERRQVCCELITVTVGAGVRRYVDNVVAALLVSGLPVVLWWTGRPRPDEHAFEAMARALVDRVIVDTGAAGEDAADLAAVARWAAQEGRHASLGDLAWGRIRPWRQAIAEFFDPEPARPLLFHLREVELAYAGRHPPAGALLLLGWLASRLHLRLLDTTREGDGLRAVYRSPARLVDVWLRPAGGTGGGRLESVALIAGAAPHRFQARRTDGELLATTVLMADRPAQERATAMPEQPDEALIGELLDPQGHDAVYEAALARAAELARTAGPAG
jgi:glucose-6-phosphate dehydrogenase assembly protein OpcA